MSAPAEGKAGLVGRLVSAVFLGAIALTLAVGAFAPASWQTALATEGPGCPFRRITGIDCPFCGMTRATIAFGRGDLHGALAYHPLAPLVLGGFIIILGIIVAGRTDALLHRRRPYLLLGAILAIWGLRLALQ